MQNLVYLWKIRCTIRTEVFICAAGGTAHVTMCCSNDLFLCYQLADLDVIAPAVTLAAVPLLTCSFARSADPLWAGARAAAAPGLVCRVDFYE